MPSDTPQQFDIPAPYGRDPGMSFPAPQGRDPGMDITVPQQQTLPMESPNPQHSVMDLLKNLMAQRHSQLAQPVPAPVPGQTDTTPPPYMQSHQWAKQRFLFGLAGVIKNADSMHKQKELAKAESDWNILQTVISRNTDTNTGQVDQQKLMQDPLAMSILGDPKKLKRMSKALNQDWLNPKSSPEYQALQKSMQTTDQKHQAATGLKGIFQKLMGRQAPPSPEARAALASSVASRAPLTPEQGVDAKTLLEFYKTAADFGYKDKEFALRQKELEEKHQEHLDNIQLRRDQLEQQNKIAEERLKDQKLSEQDRADAAKQRNDIQREMLQLRRDELRDKYSYAETPKQRQGVLDSAIKDIQTQRGSAYKRLQDSEKRGVIARTFGMGEDANTVRSEIARYDAAIQMLNQRRQAILSGLVDGGAAINEAYESLNPDAVPKK